MQILLANAQIVDATMPEPHLGNVLVEDGLIRDLDASAGAAEGRVIIDLHGLTLMPGLIDCHVHVAGYPTSFHAYPACCPGGQDLARRVDR